MTLARWPRNHVNTFDMTGNEIMSIIFTDTSILVDWYECRDVIVYVLTTTVEDGLLAYKQRNLSSVPS
jgi:hypothetical protein